MHRRAFLAGVAGFLAAPAIVRAGSLMPVSVPKTWKWVESGMVVSFDYGIPPDMIRMLRETANMQAQYYADLYDNLGFTGAGQ